MNCATVSAPWMRIRASRWRTRAAAAAGAALLLNRRNIVAAATNAVTRERRPVLDPGATWPDSVVVVVAVGPSPPCLLAGGRPSLAPAGLFFLRPGSFLASLFLYAASFCALLLSVGFFFACFSDVFFACFGVCFGVCSDVCCFGVCSGVCSDVARAF